MEAGQLTHKKPAGNPGCGFCFLLRVNLPADGREQDTGTRPTEHFGVLHSVRAASARSPDPLRRGDR